MKQFWKVGVGLILGVSLSACALSGPMLEASRSHRSGIVWPKNQALPTFAEAKRLDVADIEALPGDEQLALVTLQGLVNREVPRVYLLQSNDDEGKYTWLRDGLKLGYRVHKNPWSLLNKYGQHVEGMIVYDPEVADSINVATTLAGLRNGIVVSPALAERLDNDYGFEVIEDLRGRFSDRLDAYTWQVNNLWDETTRRMLIGLAPTRSVEVPPGIPEYFETLLTEEEQVRDASNRQVYDLDLSSALGGDDVYVRFDDAFTDDGWGPAVHEVTVQADGETIAQFVPGSPEEEAFLYDTGGSQLNEGEDPHRFADNGRYFVYRFTPPEGAGSMTLSVEMWNQFKVSAASQQPPTSSLQVPFGMLRDYAVANRAMVFYLDPNIAAERALFERIMADVEPYTPYLGWFAQDVAGEFSGTELTSEYGVYVLAADWFSNMTVFAGTRAEVVKPEPGRVPKLRNKIYLTFTVSEGDNLQYNQHRLRVLWDDPYRGSVPINWSTSPLLLDAAPAILNYYQRTATANDLLIAGPSGAGYIYPTPWPDDAFDVFTEQTAKYMKRTGMDVVYVLNRVDGVSVPLSASEAAAYETIGLEGLQIDYTTTTELSFLEGGTPLSTVRGVGSVSEAEEAIAEAAEGWDGDSPLFLSIGILAWTLTPEDIDGLADSLSSDFRVVRADHFFKLARAAYGD